MAMALISAGLVIVCAPPFTERLRAQTESDPTAEFKQMSGEISAARLSGGEENEAEMDKAFAYLDAVAISALNVSAEPNLDGANRGLAGLASHTPPVGENYRLVNLGGAPPAYAMVINFGLGGPAAVRIYAGSAGNYALAARIDHFVQKDFLDSDIELVPVSKSDPVFVTVSGRTDDLSTGLFSAWQFDGHRVLNLWNSDLPSNRAMRPTKTVFVSRTVPRWMRIVRHSASRCHATSIVFNQEDGRRSKRLTCRRQAQRRNKCGVEWPAPRVINSGHPTTSICLKSTSKC